MGAARIGWARRGLVRYGWARQGMGSIMNKLFILALLIALFCGCQSKSKLSRDQVLEARKKFSVEVISSDLSQVFGERNIYVRLKVSNGSTVTLPFLTVFTKTFDVSGKMLLRARLPPIPTGNLKPNETAQFDFYPPVYHYQNSKVMVEVEQIIDERALQFFKELE